MRVFVGTFVYVAIYWPNFGQNFKENWCLCTITKSYEKIFLSYTHMTIWKHTLQLRRLMMKHSQFDPFHIK
jgi:hypothetical protein